MKNQQLKKVGNYYILSQIGKGSFGQVFKGKKEGSGDIYAVKMIRLNGLSPQLQEEVTKQMNIIKNIDHPNIVKLHDSFQTRNNFYLVLDYCELGDLERYLADYHTHQLPQETAQRIMYCLADAVSFIHSKDIAHRDIKLANILITKNYEIKLADFGLAKENSSILMETNCGSRITMAPEIILNEPYDKKVDVWALGCIAYRLVYGDYPFPRKEGLKAFTDYVLSKPFTIPNEPQMPMDFKQLLIGSLDKNPKTRNNIKDFMKNKWVMEGKDSEIGDGKKKSGVDEFLRNLSTQFKIDEDQESSKQNQIQRMIAERVNRNLKLQIQKVLRRHVETREKLLSFKDQLEEEITNLILHMDFYVLHYLKNMNIKVGKEHTTQTIKAFELQGIQFPSPILNQQNKSNPSGEILLKFVEKISKGKFSSKQKIRRYHLIYEILGFSNIFQIRIVIKFADHIYQDIEIGNILERIKNGDVKEQISHSVQIKTGNVVTIAMECEDKDKQANQKRAELRKRFKKRIDELEKEIEQH